MSERAPARDESTALSVGLFGTPRFEVAGQPIKFAKRERTVAMLARLILQRGAPIARDALAFTIFPDEDEPTAIAELRRYLYRAGKALPAQPAGEAWLTSDGETVRWNARARATVDVFEFEQSSANPDLYERALTLYTGDLLEDCYDDWIVVERQRLRAKYLEMLGCALERYRSERRYSQAITCGGRILAIEPWREDTVRSLMSVRYESGDAAGALAEYERFIRRLRDEMLLSPMPETLALRDQIFRGEIPAGTFARHDMTPNGERRRGAAVLPFVGRKNELADLRNAWSRAARGSATLLIIEGEAGGGKSRLAAELARHVQSEGGRTFAGTTSAPEALPNQAIVETLRAAMPLLLAHPPNDARRAILAPLLPELTTSGTPRDAPHDPARATARLHDALADAIRRLSSGRPLLLILEDVQWAGAATLDALLAIMRELGRSPVLVIATARGEETPPGHRLRSVTRDLATNGLAREVLLPRLTEVDVIDLVTRVATRRSAPDEFARDLFLRSEGNALFLSELVSGALEGDESGAVTIAAVITARLARLSECALTVAEIAAIAGHGCDAALVRDVAGLSATDIALGFDELLDRRIVREAGARARHDYVFTHHLIADAVYAAVAAPVRARRHGRIARLLEAQWTASDPGSEQEIARHYETAGHLEDAARWYVRAATAAASLYAYADALALATRGLTLEPPPNVERELREIRERVRDLRGERAEQRADIDALERLAGEDPQRRFQVLRRRITLARTLGESDEEGALIARLAAFESELGPPARAEALLQSATHAAQCSHPLEAAAAAREALALFEATDGTRAQLECLVILVEASANTGDFAASRDYLARMHERAADSGDKLVEARALTAAATSALLLHDYRTCRDLSRAALGIAVDIGDRDGEAAAAGRIGAVNAWLGDYTAALRDFERARATYASIGNKRGLAITYTNRTLLLMRLGLFDEALDSIARSSELFATAGERRTMVANRVNESFVRLQQGDARAAKASALAALELARDIHFPVFEAAALSNLGNAERALGDHAAAIDAMERGIALRRPLQDARDFADDLADLVLAYASAGYGSKAALIAEELCALDGGTFPAALWPHYVRWTIACGFAANGEAARATENAVRATTELRAFAATIDDEPTRAAFLAVAINRTIADGITAR